MVKETERKKPYRPRAPHKDGCQCAVCKSKRGVKAEVAAPVAPAPPAPSMVLASSLKPRDKFEFSGQTYMAGMKEADFVYGVNIATPGAPLLTLGLNAKVKLIK